MTGRLGKKKKVVGAKQVRRALDSGHAQLVYIARDADKKVVAGIEKFCLEKQIQVIEVDNMKKLGEACDIDISAATAALLK